MVEASKYVGPWRQTIALTARSRGGILPPGPVGVELAFVMPRPKQTPKRTPPAIKRPDTDKLARAVLDAITGVWIADDSHVTRLVASKRIAEPDEQPGVAITCTPLTHCWVCRQDLDPETAAARDKTGCGTHCQEATE